MSDAPLVPDPTYFTLKNATDGSSALSYTGARSQTLSLKVSALGLSKAGLSGQYKDLLGVPSFATVAYTGSYASLSGTPALSAVARSGLYDDLQGLPSLFDGKYTSLKNVPSFAQVAFTGAYASLVGRPTISAVGLSGSYSDLLGVPSLAPVATLGTYASLSGLPSLFDGTWTSLTGKPTFATVATSGSYADLLNRPTLFSGSYLDLTNRPTFATVATSGSYTDLLNRPTLFSGSYLDLTNRPTFATVATSGSYLDLLNRPTLFSGSYTDLTNKPSLFDGTWSSLTGKPTFSTVATSGSYLDLLNRPTLFSGSYIDLTNKPAFATVATSGSYLDLLNRPALFDGTWTSLTGKPTFATVATSGSYTDLTNKPTFATVATSGSYLDLTNKPGVASFIAYTKATDYVAVSAAADWSGVDTTTPYWNIVLHFSPGDTHQGYIYSSLDSDSTGSGWIDYTVATGAKTAIIACLNWSNCRYFDIYGRKPDNSYVFILRHNAIQSVRNSVSGYDHDGSCLITVPGVDAYNRIRVQLVKGRAHLMGIGWSSEDRHVNSMTGTGQIHADNVYGPVATATTATNLSGGSVSATSVTASGDIRGASLLVNGSGTWTAGAIYSDTNWGILMRMARASPTIAQFAMYDSSGNIQLMNIDASLNANFPNRMSIGGVCTHNNPLWCVSKYSMGNYAGQLQFNTTDALRNCATNAIGYVYNASLGYWVYSGNWYTVQPYASGYYHLTFHSFADYYDSVGGGVWFTVNGGKRGARIYSNKAANQYQAGFCLAITTYLNANDTVGVYSDHALHGNDNCSFSGFMIG
jgi:hypothetical protein